MENKPLTIYNIFVYEYIPGHGDSHRNYETSALYKKFAIKLALEKLDEILRDNEERFYEDCNDEKDCQKVDEIIEKWKKECEDRLDWDVNDLFRKLGTDHDCYGEHAVVIQEKELKG